MFALLLVCAVLAFYFLEQSCKRPHLFPPGPPLLPIVGNLLSVFLKVKKLKYHHKVWQYWSQKYGDLIGLKLGSINVVIVTGIDLIKEVSHREVFDGRPDGFFYTMRSFGKKLGLVFSDGSSWIKTRRLVLKYLKGFGYNTRFMEAYIAEECDSLVKLQTTLAGQPILVNQMFHVSIVNILWRLVAGKRYDLSDDELKKLCALITKLFRAVDMSGGILNFLPFLRHIIPGLIGYTELQSAHKALHNFIEEIIKQHEKNLDIENPRDVIDALLIDIIEHKNKAVAYEELQVVCLDLLEAGMETVSNTAVFMLLHVVRNEEVQMKLHEEIDRVIGKNRSPAFKDRQRMSYTEAVLHETLRLSSVAPMGIPHMAREDTRLGDYVIPKGTFILLALYDLHNCDRWNDPHTFKPERFLTESGNLIQHDWLLPFGAGKRRCIGEGLARSELFMFLTHLLQKFHLKFPDNEPLPSTEPVEGLSLSAKPFRIIFEPRS